MGQDFDTYYELAYLIAILFTIGGAATIAVIMLKLIDELSKLFFRQEGQVPEEQDVPFQQEPALLIEVEE